MAGGLAWLSRKTTVPSPYRVKLGADVARNSTGTKPPLSSTRSTTSLARVGWSIPATALGVGWGEGPAEGPDEGPDVPSAAGLQAAARRRRLAASARRAG